MKNIVAIGGGHGLSTILSGIKDLEDVNISSIVTVADDGGSTGRLRKRYTIPAMGDVRNDIVALSNSDQLLHDLMNYRFEGEDNMDIAGHSLGNLILTAITNMTGSFDRAIKITSELLKIKGRVIPSTLESVSLYALMDDETIIKGEASIPSYNHHIKKVFYDHDVKGNREAIDAIMDADLIILGIGSLYTSILPNVIIKDINDALKKTKGKIIYFANCMTQNNETYNYDLKEHIDALKAHDVNVDLIVKHCDKIPNDILEKYKAQNSIEVIDNKNTGIEVIEKELLDFSKGLVRHDPKKIKEVIKGLL